MKMISDDTAVNGINLKLEMSAFVRLAYVWE